MKKLASCLLIIFTMMYLILISAVLDSCYYYGSGYSVTAADLVMVLPTWKIIIFPMLCLIIAIVLLVIGSNKEDKNPELN